MLAMDAAWWMAVRRLTTNKLWRAVAAVFLGGQAVVFLLMYIGSRLEIDPLRHPPKPLLVAVIVWHFFGVAVSLPIVLVRICAWFVRGIGNAVGARRERLPSAKALTRREFIGAAAALAPPLFTIGLTGFALAQLNTFRVRRFTLSIPALPRALDGMTIAQVADIHVGRLTCGRVLRDMVNTTNNLRADLVLLTGDLINYELSDLSEGIALVKAMEGRFGQWMVEGNHDLFENAAEFDRRIKAAGIPLLLNESAVTHVRGYPVQLLGLRWMLGDTRHGDYLAQFWIRKLMKERQPDAFPILLAHHPHAFDAAATAGLPLTLSGHTHGGQLMFDSKLGVGPIFFRYWSGLYQRGASQLVVSNGVGNVFPVRVNAPAEILHLTLRSAPAV
jgi:hypothetical protein